MLFRLIWDEETGGIFSLPDILIEKDGRGRELFWLLSPALPFVFIEEMSAGMRQNSQRGHLDPYSVCPGVLAHQVFRQVSSPKEVLVNLKKAAQELGMSLPEMSWKAGERAGKNTRKVQEDKDTQIHMGTAVSEEWDEKTDCHVRYGELSGGCVYDEAPLIEGNLYEDLARRLRGRHVADQEVLRLAREGACPEKEVWRFLQCKVAEGRAVWLGAVGRRRWGMVCRRCGCRTVEEWPAFYRRGYSCGECAALGGMSSLNVLWRCLDSKPCRDSKACPEDVCALDNTLIQGKHMGILSMPFTLSQAQQKASLELERSARPRVLVWAACGAGKTEVCFSRIAQALQEGKRVLFAAPRRDVIHDIAPRLATAFPRVDQVMLSGASSARFTGSRLIAATTHQVVRFYEAFDLIIMDELDAFPFTDGDFLRRALEQALRPGGDIVYLTATPDPRILREVRAGRCQLIYLPARYHRQPLPVPVWKKCTIPFWEDVTAGNAEGDSKRVQALTKKNEIRDVLERLSGKGTTLCFVPRIADVPLWIKWLKSLLPQKSISGSWSSDPDRSDKIEALVRGAYDIFVTTTILERGITLDAAQVAVIWADHPLFEDRTLVQMAGRVGRKRENPDGEAVFLAERCSKAMLRAERWIMGQNSLALKQGLIDVPAPGQGKVIN